VCSGGVVLDDFVDRAFTASLSISRSLERISSRFDRLNAFSFVLSFFSLESMTVEKRLVVSRVDLSSALLDSFIRFSFLSVFSESRSFLLRGENTSSTSTGNSRSEDHFSFDSRRGRSMIFEPGLVFPVTFEV
jgi:hypothetical protein